MGPVRKFSSIVHIAVNFLLRGHRQLSDYNHSPFLYNVHCTMYIVQCTLYNVHCTMYIVQCTLYNVHCTMYIVQSVKAAHNNSIRCKRLQSLLSNLGLTALSQVSFQKITKFLQQMHLR